MTALPEKISIGDLYGPAMGMMEQAEADSYFELLVERNMTFWAKPREEAEKIERDNLGYFAGYYSEETRERIEKLFRCAHPFFGAIAEKGPPTPEEAFNMGMDMAKKSR